MLRRLSLILVFGLALMPHAEAQQTPPQNTPAPPPPAPCVGEEHHQFDFWLGTWDVRSKARPNRPPARNVITSAHGGCLVHEQYVAGAYNGSSLNFYNQASKSWHQTWIDNQGTALFLKGGLNDQGQMVLSSDASVNPVQRITWTPQKNGDVRQHWQQSTDGGKTWNDVFDGIYSKVEG